MPTELTDNQASSWTMNTVSAGTSSACAYTYISLYTFIMLYYTYAVYKLCTHKRKESLTLRGSNAGGGEIFSTPPDVP